MVPSVEFGVVNNVSTGALVEHGENLTLQCNALYEPAHGLSTFSCNNGTWNVIPRCEPGTHFIPRVLIKCSAIKVQPTKD